MHMFTLNICLNGHEVKFERLLCGNGYYNQRFVSLVVSILWLYLPVTKVAQDIQRTQLQGGT